MLASLRPKYRTVFPSCDDYRRQGIILSDEIITSLETNTNKSLPFPGIIPDFPTGEKIGEGLSSETFSFPHHLAPFPLAVQFHPVPLEETYHLVNVSALISQLYSLTPHIILFLGYYFAPANEDQNKNKHEGELFAVSSSGSCFAPEYDACALIYERVSELPTKHHLQAEIRKYLVAQLFFTIELMRRCGFNHGDINPNNIGWSKEPNWQGRKLLNYTHYAYLIGDKTYYLPVSPIIRLFDFNMASYDDGEFHLEPGLEAQDDFEAALLFAKELLNEEEYHHLIVELEKDRLGWTCLFTMITPQPGDKIIILGSLPE